MTRETATLSIYAPTDAAHVWKTRTDVLLGGIGLWSDVFVRDLTFCARCGVSDEAAARFGWLDCKAGD